MSISTLEELLEDQLKDLYSAENQLVKSLPKMAKAASDEALRDAIESHLEETKGQVERLNTIGKSLGFTLTGKKCVAMEGLIDEGKECMEEDGPEPLIDFGIIGAAQKVEHYEISAYGTARTLAEHLGRQDVVQLLQETLDEESAADEKLTGIATSEILPNAGKEAEEEKDENTAASSRGNGRGKRSTQKSTR